ncbi:MAG: hypothetical protein WCS88_01535 [Patescibacteria group bacterium]|jgi:hypothetical protein
MFKKINNRHLSVLVAIVSIVSITLIQQYATAQWVSPDALPGQTANNRFVVNPLKENLSLNGFDITGDNITIDSNGANVINVTAPGTATFSKICLNSDESGSGSQYGCISGWPTVTGGVLGSGTEYFIPRFKNDGDATSNETTNEIENSIIKQVGGLVSMGSTDQNAGLKIFHTSAASDFIGLDISFATNNLAYPAFNLINSGESGAMKIQDTNLNVLDGKASLWLSNGGPNPTVYIKTTNNNYEPTPFVIDANGRVGVGTSTPNTASDGLVHINTNTGNAELDIQTGWTQNGHWGIYHEPVSDDLFFWKDAVNRVIFTDDGNINVFGNICDINGNNCFNGATGVSHWTEDASKNLSRVESNAFLSATSSTSLPAGAVVTGIDPNGITTSRFLWLPDKAGAIRAGTLPNLATRWSYANIGPGSVAFGVDTMASGLASVVGGGNGNIATGYYSTVSGGGSVTAESGNQATGNMTTVGGGLKNKAAGDGSTVAGGDTNVASSTRAFIGGGWLNKANVTANEAFIGGGLSNLVIGPYAVIGGGATSTASGSYSAVLGGTLNTASGPYSIVGGGDSNTASGSYSAVGGGRSNLASGLYATVAGGKNNVAAGDYSFAGGHNMQLSALADKTFAWGYSDAAVSITRDNSFIVFPTDPTGSVPRVGIGTAAPNSTLHVKSNSGNAEIDIQSGASPYWGIYQDDTTDELRFWNGANKVILKSNSLGVVSSNDATYNYVQLDYNTAEPPFTDCDEISEIGRMFWKDGVSRLMICGTGGWRSFQAL